MSELKMTSQHKTARRRCDSKICCGVNPAEFLLVNGSEKTFYCAPGFSREVCEMFKINDVFLGFRSVESKDGIVTVVVS